MSRLMLIRRPLPVLFACFIAVVAGCSDDDTPTEPEDTGTIEIDQTPDALAGAGWRLDGPRDETGSGDATLADRPAGDYTLTWNAVDGYTEPPEETQNLSSDGTITFIGTYVEEAEPTGTIEIDQTPDALDGAGWILTGPRNEAGSGDATLADMPAGAYTLAWDAVDGHITPDDDTKTLAADGTVVFDGTYVEDTAPPGYFVTIAAGAFTMGSPPDELGHDAEEAQHTVTLTETYEMQSTEVTNAQYAEMVQWAYFNGYCTATASSLRDALDGSTVELLDLDGGGCEISFGDDVFSVDAGRENDPVKEVTWYGAAAYCNWLSIRAGLPRAYYHDTWRCNDHDPYDAEGYRLPTEAEWEYACRAGSETAFANGPITDAGCQDPNLDLIGWYCGNAGVGARQVRELNDNAWGLYDMHGNLYEWCNDWHAPYDGDATDPAGPLGPSDDRVVRGGNWSYLAQYCRSASRDRYQPDTSNTYIGFRPVRTID